MSLNDFYIKELLGKGSFGSVHKVQRKSDKKIYALKQIKIAQLKEKDKKNSLNEIRILASLSHKNIIGYKESFFDENSKTLNIIMEYADDGDISIKIKNNIKKSLLFSEKTIWNWIIQLLEGINYLHENGIMHRDLKSANLFLLKNNILKIGDLNVSIISKNGMAYTQTGTPYYAPPEIWKDKPYNYKCDIWSAGCIIYEICTLHPPFRGTNFKELYNNIIKGNYLDIGFNYSNDLRNLLKMMIVVNPDKRFNVKQILNSDIVKKKIKDFNFKEDDFIGSGKAFLMKTIKLPKDMNEINRNLPKRYLEKTIREEEMMKNDDYEMSKATFYKSIMESEKNKENNLISNNIHGNNIISNNNITGNNLSNNNLKNNNNINGSNTTNKTIKTKPKEEKEFCEMETPILLNTPKLTERVFDAKLNLFERVKNMKIKNTNFNKNNITNNSYSSSENSDIIHQDISNSFNAQKNALNAINTLNNLKKRKSSLKKNFFTENSITQVLFLEEKFISKILDFLDINIINIISKNKKCCKIIKPIINKKIKAKILDYYFTKKYINYFNKIKKSLISYSSLSKLSPILLHKKYVDLLLENNQKYDQEIQKDLTRTFPNNSSFKYGNDNYNKLYHLLTVYSLFNQKIGYAQGINFIAANIILLMPKEKEEKIFMFLDGLIEKFEFGKLFGLNVGDHLKKKLNNLEQNLSKFCPEIIKFLEISNLSHEFFTTNWMLTLFANSMENKYLFIVWDFLIIFGWKFFIFFVISILNKFKNEIRKVEQNNLTYFMKNLFKSKIFEKNFKNIIDETIDLINKGYNF